MFLKISDDIFDKFPDTLLGVVVAHGVDNRGQSAAVMAALRAEEARVREALAGVNVREHPHIVAWREAYRAFGANPKDYPSSIENLLKRVQKGQSLPHINTLVDIYNAISLKHTLPVGGEDLEHIAGDVWLTIATADEAPIKLLGESEARAPKVGEVIYKDNFGAICRRWNWKEAERTKLTEETRHLFLVIEGLPPIGRALLETATRELAECVQQYCGGSVRRTLLDSSVRSMDLSSV